MKKESEFADVYEIHATKDKWHAEDCGEFGNVFAGCINQRLKGSQPGS